MCDSISGTSIEHSGTLQHLTASLIAAQKEFRVARKSSDNPYFKSKYADLAEIMDVARGPLAKHGLAVSQPVSGNGSTAIVTTILLHESGEWMSSSFAISPKEPSPQALGSAITYARRYSLAATLGIVADDDDDGEHAEGRDQKSSRKVISMKDAVDSASRVEVKVEAKPEHRQAEKPADTGALRDDLIQRILGVLKEMFPESTAKARREMLAVIQSCFSVPKWTGVVILPLVDLQNGYQKLMDLAAKAKPAHEEKTAEVVDIGF